MADPIVNAMQGTLQVADRSTDFHPYEWLRTIYKIRPLDTDLLTNFMDSMGSGKTQSYRFNWTQQPFNNDRGDVTDVYTNSALSSAYASGGADGDVLYLNVSAADASKVLPGDTILVCDNATNNQVYRSLEVNNVTVSGANSYFTCTLEETDTGNALASATLTFRVVGNSMEELEELPDAVYEEPTWYYNLSQTMSATSRLSEREIIELERVDPKIRSRAKVQALDRLRRYREKMRLFGSRRDNGNGKTKSGGHRWWLTNAAGGNGANVINWLTDTTYSDAGQTWLEGAPDFFAELNEALGRNSKPGSHKKVYCGGLAMVAIDRMVRDLGWYDIGETTDSYGFTVRRIKALSQTWDLYQHPLLSEDPAMRRMMILVEPQKFQTMTLRPIRFIPPRSWNETDLQVYDQSENCGYLVDEGVKIVDFSAHAIITNVGLDK